MERGAGLPGQGPAQRSGGAPVHAPVPDSKAGARPSKAGVVYGIGGA